MNRRIYALAGGCALALMVALGVFAANDWFPKTDAFSGRKTGWFGKELPKHATSAWNPFPPPPPTPQLSKEYIYAGSRLLAVEDANAAAAPPADIAVWRRSNGNWMVQGQTGSAAAAFSWGGTATDTPVPGDYDGDGKTDFSVYRNESTVVWYIYTSGGSGWYPDFWGQQNDLPTAADFDGDGKTDVAVFRPGTGTWWIRKSSNGTYYSVGYGVGGDLPAPADYDGDGRADIALYRASDQAFYILPSATNASYAVYIGQIGTHAVSSDYDGDGKADPAIYKSSTAYWYVHQSTTNALASNLWGNNGTSGCTGPCSALVPVHNDYDGDGKTDLAVWDNASSAVWTIKRSSNATTRTEIFGTTGDIPVPAYYRR